MGMGSLSTNFDSSLASEFEFKKPDYGRSISDVFMNFAQAVIDWSQDLDFLTYKESPPFSKQCPGLPSWVPDWTISPSKIPQRISNNSLNPYDWSSPINMAYRPWEYTWIPNSRLMAVVGLSTGGSNKIVKVSKVIPWNADDVITLNEYENFFSEHISSFLCKSPRELSRLSPARNFESSIFQNLFWNIYDLYSRALGADFLPEGRTPRGAEYFHGPFEYLVQSRKENGFRVNGE